jgi:organic radical activating enzyme
MGREFLAGVNSMPPYELGFSDVFTSINGEVSPCKQGSIATFLRLSSGCNLKCPWCDTKNHFERKFNLRDFEVNKIEAALSKMSGGPIAKNITITGGEPLLAHQLHTQPFVHLLRSLHDLGHTIAIETNGTYRLPDPLRNFVAGFVVDYKFFLLDMGWKINKAFAACADLNESDYVKLVIDQYHHIGLAKQFLSYYTSLVEPEHHPTFAVSVINEGGKHVLDPSDVIKSFADDGYDILLNVQIHKFLNVP